MGFACIKESDYLSCVQKIQFLLADLYSKYSHSFKSDIATDKKEEIFRQIINDDLRNYGFPAVS